MRDTIKSSNPWGIPGESKHKWPLKIEKFYHQQASPPRQPSGEFYGRSTQKDQNLFPKKVKDHQNNQFLKRKIIFQTSSFGFHVNFAWCTSWCLNQPLKKMCSSNWIISPNRGKNRSCFKTTTPVAFWNC